MNQGGCPTEQQANELTMAQCKATRDFESQNRYQGVKVTHDRYCYTLLYWRRTVQQGPEVLPAEL